MAKTSTALAPFNIMGLPALAKTLAVVIDIDGEKLKAEVEQYTKDIATRTLAANRIKIEDDDTNQAAADARNEFGRREKALTEIVERIKEPINKVRAEVLKMEHALVDPEANGKAALTKKMEAYILSCRKVKAEVDNSLARAANAHRSDLTKEAEDLMALGYVAEAEQKLQQARMTTTPTVVDPTEKIAGVRVGDKYTAKVTDIIALAKAIVEGKIPLLHEVKGEMRPVLLVDQVVLNAVQSRQQNSLDWPGVVVEEGVRIGTKA